MKHKFHLIHTTCRRCGKPIVTGSRSLWGAEAARTLYAGICSECITPAERAEIEKAVSAAALATVTKG